MCGIDIVYIPRFKETILKYGPVSMENSFIKRVFNEEEITHILSRKDPFDGLAGRFAAKEATIKALNNIKKIAELKSISIVGVVPQVKLLDPELTQVTLSVSISHDGDYAIAMVLYQIAFKNELTAL